MWRAVRRELATLEWDPQPAPGCDLLSEWTATVASMLNLRRSLGPLTDPDDPFALLAIATRGANRAGGDRPAIMSASLRPLRDALGTDEPAAANLPQAEGVRQIEVLTHLAYELAHWARIHAGDHPSRGWLSAAENSLDAALHRPAPRTSFSAALAGWARALADVQRNPEPALRRSVALGHLAILENAHAVLEDAIGRGAFRLGYGQEVTAGVRALGRAHRATITAIDRVPIDTSAGARTVMLELARSTRRLTDRTQRPADPTAHIDALLRTDMAHADLVADLTRHPQARAAADRLQRLGLEYLANPAKLRRDIVRNSAPPSSPVPTRRTAGVTASIDPGTTLDAATVNALCEARNRGRLAAQADPANPPAELSGSDPSTWPRLVEEGRQAVADLVTSAMPLVRVRAFRGADSPDAQGALFLALTKAANAYEPTRTEGANWHAYAWRALDYEQWRGLDQAGVPRPRRAMPGPPVTLLGDREVSTFTPSPEEIVLGGRIGVEVVTDALDSLPAPLREPLHRLIAGQPVAEIAADLGMSPSTVRRRIDAARDILRPQLNNVEAAPTGNEHRRERWETSTPLPGEMDTHRGRPTVTPRISR